MIEQANHQHFRAKQIFIRVMEQDAIAGSDADSLDGFLAMQCGDDAGLQQQVRTLLLAHQSSDAMLDRVDSQSWDETPGGALRPGQQVGSYEVQELIGEGGMGLVYLARQQEPIERSVALKIIKPGLDTREMLRRFRLEQRTLARLQHPNIARVFEAGQTEAGRAYFAMELASGIAITRFCDRERLGIAERLRLFQQVCMAVAHAHHRGIIHRDLKPSHILVARDNEATSLKVIDFGLVKAIAGPGDRGSRLTQIRRALGTPRYMSPEQSEEKGSDVDTRSDIYALGVILHELLIGKTPAECAESGDAPQRSGGLSLLDTNLPRPSHRFKRFPQHEREQIAAQRSQLPPERVDPGQLIKTLRGDLDWIVMKALEEDRERRYETAAAFSDDIDCFLRGDAIAARPPSVAYRTRKFARRHRGALATVALVFVSLIAGLSVALVQRNDAQQARQVAEKTLREVRIQKARADSLLYAADIRLAARALADGDVRQSIELLHRHAVPPGSVSSPSLEWRYLMNQAAGTPVSCQVSDHALYTVHPAPDGEHVVIGGASGEIFVVNLQSMKVVDAFDSGQLEVNGLSYSPDGTKLVSAGDDGNLRIWDASSFTLLQSIRFGEEKAYQAIFDPSGQYLIACGRANDARVFSADTGTLIHSLDAHERSVEQMVLDPEGDKLRCVSSDGRVSTWEWKTGRRLSLFHPEKSRLSCVEYSDDGRWCVVGSIRGLVRVHGSNRAHVYLNDGVQNLAIAPDCESVAVATRAGTIHRLGLTSLSTQSDPLSSSETRQVHSGRAYALCWIDEDIVVSVGEDGYLRRTRLSKQVPGVGEIEGVNANLVAVSPNGNLVAWAHERESGLYDLTRNCPVPLGSLPGDHVYSSAAFSPDGQWLLFGTDNGRVVQIAINDPQKISVRRLPSDPVVSRLVFSGNGRRLAISNRVGQETIVADFPTFDVRFHQSNNDIPNVSLSWDGRHLAVSRGRDLLVYDIDEGRQVAESINHHAEAISDLVFFERSDVLVTLAADRAVRTWNWIEDGEPQLVGIQERVGPSAVAVTRDARTLLTCGWSGAVTVWNLPSGQELFTLAETSEQFLTMQLSADESRLVLLEGSGRIRWFAFDH